MRLRSDILLRFMDDFYLFADDEEVINMDFVLIQQLLGEKGLSLNPAKTAYEEERKNIAEKVDEMKVSLLKARRFIIEISGIEIEDEDLEESALTDEQVEYLLDLLKNPDIEESDAELVLVLLRNHGEDDLAARSVPPAFPGFESERLSLCAGCQRQRQRCASADCLQLCFRRGLRNGRPVVLDGEIVRGIPEQNVPLSRHPSCNLPTSKRNGRFKSEGVGNTRTALRNA